ncbi:hypothetical protein BKA66DRAFT_478798 [Pyrenochaeta sp. MPI-SDFR-AT-0127]|nr:hypothetical protein BKA66DRAFT_478798 [Pyrenochaeta sp. MPI-SDFR-AT-0127]
MESPADIASYDAPHLRTGAILSITEKDGEYSVTQVPLETALPKPVPASRHEINFNFGPARLTGYVVTETWEIGVEIYVFGIRIGNFYGNVKQGLVINVDIFLAKGKIKFYLKNNKEVWVEIGLNVRFDGSYNTNVRLFTV